MAEQEENTEQPVQQEETRQVRRCRQCREQGHDIRNCPLFEKVHREALREYEKWINYCIVDYHTCNKWQYDNDNDFQTIPEDIELLQLFIDNNNNEDAISTVLTTPTTWIKNQTIEKLRILAHVFRYPYKTAPYKTFTKEQWVQLLHCVLFIEAESRGTRKYSVSEALPYLASSIQAFSHIQSVYDRIKDIPNIGDEVLRMYQLKPIEDRYVRVRELRNYTMRNLRFITQDIDRNTREERDVRRRIAELRSKKTRIELEKHRLQNRMEQYEIEMRLFMMVPPDPPEISFHSYEDKLPDHIDCPVCFEYITSKDIVMLNCGHHFCNSCVFTTIMNKYRSRTQELDPCPCPYCRTRIRKLYGHQEEMKKSMLTIVQKQNVPNDIISLVGGRQNDNIPPIPRVATTPRLTT